MLDSDWLSHVRSRCKLQSNTHLCLLCVLLGNLFVATTTVSEELHCLVEEYCNYIITLLKNNRKCNGYNGNCIGFNGIYNGVYWYVMDYIAGMEKCPKHSFTGKR